MAVSRFSNFDQDWWANKVSLPGSYLNTTSGLIELINTFFIYYGIHILVNLEILTKCRAEIKMASPKSGRRGGGRGAQICERFIQDLVSYKTPQNLEIGRGRVCVKDNMGTQLYIRRFFSLFFGGNWGVSEGVPRAGSCNYGIFSDLPEIHRGEIVRTCIFRIKPSAIWVGCRGERAFVCRWWNWFRSSAYIFKQMAGSDGEGLRRVIDTYRLVKPEKGPKPI